MHEAVGYILLWFCEEYKGRRFVFARLVTCQGGRRGSFKISGSAATQE